MELPINMTPNSFRKLHLRTTEYKQPQNNNDNGHKKLTLIIIAPKHANALPSACCTRVTVKVNAAFLGSVSKLSLLI